jgi:hypothetical protein
MACDTRVTSCDTIILRVLFIGLVLICADRRGLIDGTIAGDCRLRCRGVLSLFLSLFNSYFPRLACCSQHSCCFSFLRTLSRQCAYLNFSCSCCSCFLISVIHLFSSVCALYAACDLRLLVQSSVSPSFASSSTNASDYNIGQYSLFRLRLMHAHPIWSDLRLQSSVSPGFASSSTNASDYNIGQYSLFRLRLMHAHSYLVCRACLR